MEIAMSLLDTLRAFSHAERLNVESVGNEINEINEESPQPIEKASFSEGRKAEGNYEISPESPPEAPPRDFFRNSQPWSGVDESQTLSMGCLVNSSNSFISSPNNSAAVFADRLGSVDESEIPLADATKPTELGLSQSPKHATHGSVYGVRDGALEADPATWRDLYDERSAIRQYDGHYSRAEAEALAWSEVQTRWQMECGERVSRDLCAGCRRSIGTEKALDLIDGTRVHLDDENACLIRHGKRWRTAATRALMALGLRPPVGVAEHE
jgi:hypothetical protein